MNRYFRELSVASALLLLLGVLAIWAPHFYQPQPLLSRFTAQSPTLILTIGMTLVMLVRQIDISVGSQFGICAVVAGLLAGKGLPMPLVFLATLTTGTLMGALNGTLVATLGLPSIVVSLATMVTWAEVLRLTQQGRLINLPEGTQWFGLSQVNGQLLILAGAIAFLTFSAWFLKNRAAGRFVYAVGSDAEAARLAGINPKTTTFMVFAVMGALSGLAALINLVQSPQVDPKCGVGLELRAIAAAVVGGVAVSGGRGRLWGTFLGLLLLSTINPALTFLHVEAYWEKAIQGLVILLAVVADGFRSRNQNA
ncbi:MAG: ABC transporter permease [Verrucomicrobiota bacterium]